MSMSYRNANHNEGFILNLKRTKQQPNDDKPIRLLFMTPVREGVD